MAAGPDSANAEEESCDAGANDFGDNSNEHAESSKLTVGDYSQTKTVLRSADIRRIICIDDGFTDAGAIDTETIIAAVAIGEVPTERVKQVSFELYGAEVDIADKSDFEAHAQWLRERSEELSDDMWRALSRDLPEDPQAAKTAKDAETLQELRTFAENVDIEFIPLNLRGWTEREPELLGLEGCALIFFDRNLSDDGGRENEGEFLLEASVKKYSPEKIIAVLFTHYVTADGEYGQWLSISESNSDLVDRVLVISKERIRAEQHTFAGVLKMAVLAPRLRRVVNRVSEGFAESASSASGLLVGLSPHLLHSLLVTSAEREGSWGPDGLISIVSAEMRRRVEGFVREDAAIRKDALQIAELSRNSTEIWLPGAEAHEYDVLNRRRVFDDLEHVNELRLPIDTGDIFAFFDPSKALSDQAEAVSFWLLVEQRCDVAIRKGGKRSREPSLMPLVRIAKPNDDVIVKLYDPKRVQLFSAPVANHAASEVRLADRCFALAIALDFCALNSDGIARCATTGVPDVGGLMPTWVERAKYCQNWTQKKVSAYKRMRSNLPRNVSAEIVHFMYGAVTGALKETVGFSSVIDIERDTVVFGVRRIARLREPYAQDVMDRLSALSSRVPLEAAILPG